MKILVVTSVFPNSKQPNLGVFVKERMFHVARHCELKVVAPVPWFPLLNLFLADYRPSVPFHEVIDGIDVYHPRYFNIPRYCKFLDGLLFCLSSALTLRKVKKIFDFDLIDAHFVYPDGLGAILLGQLFRRPVVITARGTLRKYLSSPLIKPQLRYALSRARKVFTVCEDLRQAAISAGAVEQNTLVVANGIDTAKFRRQDRAEMRRKLGIPLDAKVIISVGGLVERKGFHRVIEVLPKLRKSFPKLLYIIVGGASVEGNNEALLRRMVGEYQLDSSVRFTGTLSHEKLCEWLNAADLFCLATSNEGWANVFLEAMACGLPVVTTQVGGNGEVVSSAELGTLVPFGDREALAEALLQALSKTWNSDRLREYAERNRWEQRVEELLWHFKQVCAESPLVEPVALPRKG